jgi:hypothetical protein
VFGVDVGLAASSFGDPRRRHQILMLHQRRRYQRQLVAPQRQQKMLIGFLVANLRVPKAFPNHAIRWGGTPSVRMSAYDIGYLYCTREHTSCECRYKSTYYTFDVT